MAGGDAGTEAFCHHLVTCEERQQSGLAQEERQNRGVCVCVGPGVCIYISTDN